MNDNKQHPLMMHEIPENERPREKIMRFGAGILSIPELLAVLIGSGNGEESALNLAARVYAASGGNLKQLSMLAPEELMEIDGIGPAKACSIVSAMEIARRLPASVSSSSVHFSGPEDLASYFMGSMRYLKKEVFKVALLNVKNELISEESVSIGGISSASSHPREVFSLAIKKGAYAIAILHNHPSGDPTPSEKDIQVTKQIAEAGNVLGIYVLDHIIIGDGRYTSFKSCGYL